MSSGITVKNTEQSYFLPEYTVSTVFFCICKIILFCLCVITAGARFLDLDSKALKTQSL